MTYNFKNKKILITGSTSGLGLVCAKNFIDKKATVYVCGRKKRNLALLKKTIKLTFFNNKKFDNPPIVIVIIDNGMLK